MAPLGPINESKAFQSKRYSSHTTGTEVPDVYCLHLILDYPEVTTNMTFIQNNTGPFELRTQHTVRLDWHGNVICNTAVGDIVGEFISHHSIIVWPCLPSTPLLNLQYSILASTLFMLNIHRPGPRDINGPRLSNGHTSGIQPQTIRENLSMPNLRLFTPSQLMISRSQIWIAKLQYSINVWYAPTRTCWCIPVDPVLYLFMLHWTRKDD